MHVQEMGEDMFNKNGHQSIIFDRPAKQNQSIHVRDMAADERMDAWTDETQSISPHFGVRPTGAHHFLLSVCMVGNMPA